MAQESMRLGETSGDQKEVIMQPSLAIGLIAGLGVLMLVWAEYTILRDKCYKPDIREIPEDRFKQLWEYLLNEDTLFASRANFFLVAEAMLLAAFAAFSDKSPESEKLMAIIAVAGSLFALLWSYMSMRQAYLTGNTIKKLVEKQFPEYQIVIKQRSVPFLPTAGFVLGFVVPEAITIIWGFLIWTVGIG